MFAVTEEGAIAFAEVLRWDGVVSRHRCGLVRRGAPWWSTGTLPLPLLRAVVLHTKRYADGEIAPPSVTAKQDAFALAGDPLVSGRRIECVDEVDDLHRVLPPATGFPEALPIGRPVEHPDQVGACGETWPLAVLTAPSIRLRL